MTTEQGARGQNPSVNQGGQQGRQTEQRHLAAGLGPLEIDAPKAAGYYAGLAVALALGVVEPPLAVFIAAVPFFQLFTRPDASRTEWAVGEILQGAATPVGGSASPVIRIADRSQSRQPAFLASRLLGPIRDVWVDARRVAGGEKL